MQINFLAGTNYGSAPAWLGTVANQVAAFYDQLFTNNITIDVTLNWVGLPSGVLASNNLNGGPGGVTSSFSTVSNALESHATNGVQNGAYSWMPGGVSNVYVTPGDAMILGLESKQTVDIWLSVNSAGSWIENGGSFDPFAAIAHEITETAMGRLSFFPSTSTPDVMDMFRFRSSGVHNLTPGNNTSAFFSVNNGATLLGKWTNRTSAGDFGDWASGPVADDAFGGQGGGVAPISEVDIELMNVLGWHVDVVTSGVTSVISGGQTVSGFTVMNGGIFSVQSGAEADNTWYTDAQQFNDGVIAAGSSGGAGGIGFIQNGGYESSATVDGGAIEWVEGGGESVYTRALADGGIIDFGLTTHASLSGAASEEDVEGGGGSAYYTSVYSGATLSLHSGGVGFGNHIFNGGREVVYGTAELDTVEAYGTQIVSAGGLDDVSFISGYQYVYGVASGDIVSGVTAYQYIENGGSAVNAQMRDVGFQYVYSGATATRTNISATGAQLIYAGGYATGTVVSSGGVAYISAGGTGDAFNVLAGGVVYGPGVLLDHSTVAGSAMGVTVGDAYHVDSLELTSGGYASGVTVIDIIDNVLVDAGALASGTVVSADAYQTVYGRAVGTVVSSAGDEYVSSGGVASGTKILDGGYELVASGGLLVGAVVSAGGSAVLQSGGEGETLTVRAGGTLDGPGVLIGHNTVAGTVSGVTVGDPYNVDSLELLAGGVASNVTVIITADSFTIDAGASATGTVLSAYGYDNVNGFAAATIVSSGGTEYVSAGGVTSGAQVKSAGVENLASGAVADSITVSAGGALVGPGELINANFAAGAVYSVTVGDASHVGSLVLEAGAVDSASQVVSNGTEYVAPGATASGTTVLAGGLQVLSAGGTDIGVTISAGGTLELADAVIPAGVTITAGVQTGGALSGATLKSGAIVDLVGATVMSGGAVTVSSGGLAIDTTVSKGGALNVRKGGQASGTVVSSGGNETLYAKGKSFGDTVASGGTQTVLSGGVASGTEVQSGGVQVLSAGGTDINVTIDSGGTLELAAAVVSSATVIAGPQAAEVVSGASLVSGAILALIAAELLAGGSAVALGGLVESSTVSSGGNVYVSSGGVASKTVVSSGGNETVLSGGQSLAPTVANGGVETVSSGGLTSGAVISSGGFEYVLSSGTANATVVGNGGTLVVSAGGVASGLTLSAGGQVTDLGQVTISGGHTLFGALSGGGSIVKTGGGVLTLSGASPSFSGTAVINGGRIELAGANALGTGVVMFNTAAAAVLQIDAANAPGPGGLFANTLSNFSGPNDDIDLPSIPFAAGATATVSGSKLVLSEGGSNYKFKLAGSVAASYPVVNDGSGGTMIDPVDARAATFLDALAGFAAPGVGTAAVSSGSVSSFVPAIQTGSTSGAH
jgi:autotransporter passenger strand-loop-strand repeat protein